MENNDVEFMTAIMAYICDYAVENELEPNETLKVVAKNILAILEISDFNEWGHDDG